MSSLCLGSTQSAIIAAGSAGVLGVSKGGGAIGKETWWWNDKMQEMTREKKFAF